MGNILFNNFKTHLFINFFYGKNRSLYLVEQMTYGNDRKLLLEQYGIFDGCERLAHDLEQVIHDNYNLNRINVSGLGISWIENIVLEINKNGTEGSYSPEESVFDETNKVFKNIIISINNDIVFSEYLFELLMHELTHAYQDYNLRLKGMSLSSELKKTGYHNHNNEVYRNKEYDDILNDGIKEDININLSNIFYFFNNFEKPAYIASIEGKLKSCDRTFSNIAEVIYFMKSTNIYKTYEYVYECIDDMANFKSEVGRNYVMSLIPKLSNYKFTNYHDFIRWLKYKRKGIQYKFDRIIPKLAYNYLKVSEYLLPSRVMVERKKRRLVSNMINNL